MGVNGDRFVYSVADWFPNQVPFAQFHEIDPYGHRRDNPLRGSSNILDFLDYRYQKQRYIRGIFNRKINLRRLFRLYGTP
jgi:hypothetical protein